MGPQGHMVDGEMIFSFPHPFFLEVKVLAASVVTVAPQAPLSMGFSRQEHWSVLPFPSPIHESEK